MSTEQECRKAAKKVLKKLFPGYDTTEDELN
jgi:hypothetical protein